MAGVGVDFAEMEAKVMAMATNQSAAKAARDLSKKMSLAQAYGIGPDRLKSMFRPPKYIKVVGTVEDWYRLQAFAALAPGLALELRPKPAGKRKQLIGRVAAFDGPGAEFTITPPRSYHEHTLDELIARVEPIASQPYFKTGGTISTRSTGSAFGGQLPKKSGNWNQIVAGDHFKLGSI